MANTTLSPNMNLPVPVVGVDPGPQWASDINACMSLIDSHTHNVGSGIPINPAGININSDLPMTNNNLTLTRTVRFQIQPSTLSAVPDKACIYAVGVDLYYNDASGNQIRITQSGGVAGTPGSIANLISPASASYVSANQTFVWQSAANTPANMDASSVILRNLVANSKGLTLQPPAALAANYTITFPTLPPQLNIMSMDVSGNMAAAINVDNSSIELNANTLRVKAAGITNAMTANFNFVPSGAILPFGGTTAPVGFLMCDGQPYSRTGYPDLFAAIGTAYGYGNNSTTFNVPDLRGQFIRGVSGGSGRDPDAASRQASLPGGNTGNNVGSWQFGQYANHNHTLHDPGHQHISAVPYTAYVFGASGYQNYLGTAVYGESFLITFPLVAAAGTGMWLDANGGNETRPINVYVNYIIKT